MPLHLYSTRTAPRLGGPAGRVCRAASPAQAGSKPGPSSPEDSPQYRRVDFSEQQAYEARQAFCRELAKGESSNDVAEMALQVAAEDDALVSHSTVALPVRSFQARINALVDDLAGGRLQKSQASTPEETLEVVSGYLWRERGFRLPRGFTRSALQPGTLYDNPGVYESPKFGYLHDVLISREGIPAALAILLSEVLRRLLMRGAVDFAATISCPAFDRLPEAEPLAGLTRDALLRPDGTVLNTTPSSTLVELLDFLRRAYHPFPWQHAPLHQARESSEAERGAQAVMDSSAHGSEAFTSAAEVWLEGEADAVAQAIARTAAHRLQRGIWTSPGAGDLRRALVATERLVLVVDPQGEAPGRERRDLGALYLHAARLPQAQAELRAYVASSAYAEAGVNEVFLVERLLGRLEPLVAATGEGGEEAALLTLRATLALPAPEIDLERRLPLTW